ncbi:ATP sulfurylase 1 [Cucumis melo var. makuwa]|uniref:ATP sulfurylase 1 n=1 Tax=Cucumis melo var. makuwa TaxID=1194695 RepID=A0A5A7US21_CUCMM|nr:ATP sulfurylase 1 [Cucumis melo var. makuwa]TYK30156.1 ATP sulfurylase 1 [Cucumis melo var. makuwa]
MASMAAAFIKPSNPFSKSPITFSKAVTPPIKLPMSLRVKSNTRRRIRVSGGLIDPDGGKLVELIVEESMRGSKNREALSLPRIKLSRIDVQWVHVLSEGWASPLTGFMRESEFLQTLHFNSLRLQDGSVVNMSVPIVLAIDDDLKNRIGDSSKVALFGSDDRPVAILNE